MGKSAIHLARVYGERKRNFVGQHFGARGSLCPLSGTMKRCFREYIRWQREADARLDQPGLLEVDATASWRPTGGPRHSPV